MKRLIAAALVAGIFGCDAKPVPAPALTSEVTGIISLTPAMTETIFALGKGHEVIAADASSTYPKDAETKANLPYFRQLPVEPILALRPTLILTGEGAGPPAVIEQLKTAGIRIETVADADSTEGAIERVKTIASILGADPAPLIAKMTTDIETAAQSPVVKTRVIFVYARGAKLVMAAGPDTPAGKLLTLAGATVVPEDFEGFKPLTAEAVIAAAPDVIVMGEGGAQSLGGEESVFQIPGLAETPAAKARRLIVISDQKMVFGPRTGETILELKTLIRGAIAP